MNLLPQSNGVRRVNMKKKRSPKEKAQFIAKLIIIILIIGFSVQMVCNFISKETINERVDYTTVDDKRMDYRLDGSGKYTIVFDGAIGGNLEAWTPIIDDLESNGDDITTFTYNRRGYGFSDSGSRLSIEEQAQALKILLRKSGASAPYILVGEEYGSLVLTSFAEQFPDAVAGVVLVNPLNENVLKNSGFSFKTTFMNLRRRIEELGSNISLTMLMDKLGLTIDSSDFTNSLSGDSLTEFKSERTKASYTTAVVNENENLSKGLSGSQKQGVFAGKPYCLIINNDDTSLAGLGDENLTTIIKTTETKNFLSLNDSSTILSGIRLVIEKCNG